MKNIFKCFFIPSPDGKHLYRSCNLFSMDGEMLDEGVNNIYSYLSMSITGDLYSMVDIQEHLGIINQSEINPDKLLYGGGQFFCLEFHNNQVVFICNEFDAEDGWPELSCSLSFFKNALLVWQVFLQLPKSIHTRLETVIED